MFRIVLFMLSLFHRLSKFLFAEPIVPTTFREIFDVEVIGKDGSVWVVDLEEYAKSWLTLRDVVRKSGYGDDDDFLRVKFYEGYLMRYMIVVGKLLPEFARDVFFNVPVFGEFPSHKFELLPREMNFSDGSNMELECYMCDDGNFSIYGDEIRYKHFVDFDFSKKVVDVSGVEFSPKREMPVELENL